jgi:hypothetical protein
MLTAAAVRRRIPLSLSQLLDPPEPLNQLILLLSLTPTTVLWTWTLTLSLWLSFFKDGQRLRAPGLPEVPAREERRTPELSTQI